MIDLHIHSICSDGTLSPAEIVAEAVKNNVSRLAVCDHNVVAGTLETAPMAKKAGLRFLAGVEIDAMLLGRDAHILCYGADFSDANLLSRIRHARARLDWMSDELLRRMLPHFPNLDYGEYDSLSHDSSQGGWKLLQYLKAKGVTKKLDDALHFYTRHGVTYESAGFHPASEIIEAIHAAGGCAVLAHPGVTFKEGALHAAQEAMKLGVDGVECFYPRHSTELTEKLLAFCDENNLSATAGSDCHGAYSTTRVGETDTPVEKVRLRHPVLKTLL